MASIYDRNRNCKECGRIVAPSSGIFGPVVSSIFCCRRCLKSFYEEQPGRWEEEENQNRLFELQQEELEQLHLEEEHKQLLEDEQNNRELISKSKKNKLFRFSIYFFICFFILVLIRSCSL